MPPHPPAPRVLVIPVTVDMAAFVGPPSLMPHSHAPETAHSSPPPAGEQQCVAAKLIGVHSKEP